MEPVSDQEQTMVKMYRGIMLFAVVLALGITMWMVLPSKPLDLAFLRALHPKVRKEDYGTYLDFKAQPVEVEKLLDQRLNAASGWRKIGAGTGYTRYESRNRAMPILTLSPTYSAAPPPRITSSAVPAAPGGAATGGTTLEVQDSRSTVILP